ncbi:MAG: bifunctional riboflavin kinase/FAD synthetase [Candidatus Izemoplasmatales bacterium]|nr:bifunctional riboflavin kinase/FAD synthetase [Candidatus Izemoplasmatales bacterium]
MDLRIEYLDYFDTINEENLILCLGFFDGLHKAHQALVKKGQILKKEKNYKLAVLTFDRSIKLFMQNKPFYFLTSIEDKAEILKDFDVDILYVMKVSYDLIKYSPEGFIEQFLKNIKICIAGEDFTFGYKSLGKVSLLKQCKYFETIVIKEITYHGVKVGSTRIREDLYLGDIESANFLLGRPYKISGTVIKGHGIGKHLGFPTANIDFTDYLLPKLGVYFTIVEIQGVDYYAMTNVGKRPTFNDSKITLESYIFDFNKEIYSEVIKIKFIKFLRQEYYYETVDALIKQIEDDKMLVLELIEERENNAQIR